MKYLLALMILLVPFSAQQTHPLSEITPIDTNLNMGSYDITTNDLTVSGRDIYMGGASGQVWGLRHNVTNPNYGIFYLEGTPDTFYISPGGGGTTTPDFTVKGDGTVLIKTGLDIDSGKWKFPGSTTNGLFGDWVEVQNTGFYAVSGNNVSMDLDSESSYFVIRNMGDNPIVSVKGDATTGTLNVTGSDVAVSGLSCTNCVALGSETTGNYAGSSSEGGGANSCDGDTECNAAIVEVSGQTELGGRIQLGGVDSGFLTQAITGFTEPAPASDAFILIPGYTGVEDSDLRLYMLDNAERFSIYADSCGGGSCGTLDNAGLKHYFTGAGAAYHSGTLTTGGSATIGGDLTVNGGDVTINNNNGGISFNDVSKYWLTTATDWGIYWDTTANEIEFHGNGLQKFSVDLDTGDTIITGDLTVTGTDLKNIESIELSGSNLRIGENKAEDNNYEWVGFYSGTKRQGIMLWDYAWTGCTNVATDFCIVAENNQRLVLQSGDDEVYINDHLHVNGNPLFDLKKTVMSGEARFRDEPSRTYISLEPEANAYGKIGVYDEQSGWLDLVLQDGGGKVGIGTTTPTNTLTVAGSTNIANVRTVGNNACVPVNSFRDTTYSQHAIIFYEPAKLWGNSACTISRSDGVNQLCAASCFRSGSSDCSNCWGTTTYYTEGLIGIMEWR